MRYLILLLLSGCTIQYPVWLGDEGVAEMCESEGVHSFTHEGEKRAFHVSFVQPEDMYAICGDARNGKPARACIINNADIYVTPGVNCPKSMAHELSHGFGMHFVDRPTINYVSKR